jgi:hypothetical protein
MHSVVINPQPFLLDDVDNLNDSNWVASRQSALRARRSESRQSALGPIADVRVFQVKQVQHVNASGQFVLFPIAAILTSVVVLGRFELPLIDGALAKFKSD